MHMRFIKIFNRIGHVYHFLFAQSFHQQQCAKHAAVHIFLMECPLMSMKKVSDRTIYET